MIDVSDGLLADLGHIADASAVALDLNRAALEPGDPLGEAYAAPFKRPKFLFIPNGPRLAPPPTPLEWVLTGGEDHSLVATFPASTQLPSRWRVIGQVRAATNASTATNSSTATPGAGVTTRQGRPDHRRRHHRRRHPPRPPRLAALPLAPAPPTHCPGSHPLPRLPPTAPGCHPRLAGPPPLTPRTCRLRHRHQTRPVAYASDPNRRCRWRSRRSGNLSLA